MLHSYLCILLDCFFINCSELAPRHIPSLSPVLRVSPHLPRYPLLSRAHHAAAPVPLPGAEQCVQTLHCRGMRGEEG